MNDDTTLAVIQETEILGKKIKVYNSIESPLFLASDVAEWIEHSQTSKMVKSVEDDEKLMGTLFLSGQNRDTWFLTEDGLYEVCMQSRKPIAKQMKKEIKKYLKSIRLTGAAQRYTSSRPSMEKQLQMQSMAPLSTRLVFCSQSMISNRTAYPMRAKASVAMSTSMPVGVLSLFR